LIKGDAQNTDLEGFYDERDLFTWLGVLLHVISLRLQSSWFYLENLFRLVL